MHRSPAVLAMILSIAASRTTAAQQVDWSAVEGAMGRPGAAQADGVHRFSMPRNDLHVSVRGVTVDAGLALGSWVAMRPRADGTVLAMGDLVLLEDEIEPVMSRLQEGGVLQTALHNHLLFETPRVMYMHVHAEGDPVRIARTIRGALALTGTPGPAPSGGPAAPLALDTAAIAAAIGRHGSVGGGLYKVTAPRSETLRVGGTEVGASMGLATSIGFQATGAGGAVATGDFVLLPTEVNPVIVALRQAGIAVTALHNHLLLDEPHLFFMHFWASGDAVGIARGLGAALKLTAVKAGG
jgi:hypothetical protein